jgi:hypothetical protein
MKSSYIRRRYSWSYNGTTAAKRKLDVVISEISKYGQPRTCILMSADGLSILSEFSKNKALFYTNKTIQFKRPTAMKKSESN